MTRVEDHLDDCIVEDYMNKEARLKKATQLINKGKIKIDQRPAREIRFDDRAKRLTDMGLQFNGEAYVMNDINVYIIEIKCDTDEQFERKAEAIRKEIERRAEGSHERGMRPSIMIIDDPDESHDVRKNDHRG